MRSLLVLAAVLIVTATATAHTTTDPKQFVLPKSAFPSGLEVVYAGARSPSSADIQAPPGSRAWIVGYAKLKPPVQVYTSSAFVFASSGAAHTGFADVSSVFTGTYGHTPGFATVPAGRLGEEQHVWSFTGQGTPPQAMVLVHSGTVVWAVDIGFAASKQALVAELLKLAHEQKALVH